MVIFKDYNKVCRICGKEFVTRKSAQVYCDTCRAVKDVKPKGGFVELVCPSCGTKFTRRNCNQVYCSKYCYEHRNKKDGYLDTYNMRSYALYAQSRLAKCAKIAKEAGMTYGEAEKAGLFKDVK